MVLATLAVSALADLDAHSGEGRPSVPLATVDSIGRFGAFLDDHGLAWAPWFGAQASQHDQADFAAELGQLSVGTLRQSADVFATPVEKP